MTNTHQLKEHYGGWRGPARPDQRDFQFLPRTPLQAIPEAFALDIDNIPVLNQENQGSCVGHGCCGPIMFDQKKQGLPIVIPARAMIYYDARIPEGTTGYDSGATVKDGVAGVVKWGACTDKEMPYNDNVCDVAPTKAQYADGTLQEALQYSVVNFPHLDAAIFSGFPFVAGFTVYESFESNQSLDTGVVPIPKPDEAILGGHCVWFWGYNASYTETFTAPNGKKIPPRHKALRNSWGDVGDGGDFYLPQAVYFDNGNVSDCWVVERIGAH